VIITLEKNSFDLHNFGIPETGRTFLQRAAMLALQALYELQQFRLSVCLSARLSVTRRYCVKTTARSTVQFALLDSKMCLVL